jgi:DNA-binding GntR family transcriptional regulator
LGDGLWRRAAHPADLSQIEQTFTIGEADVEIARRLRLHESSPTAELRRIARDSRGTIIYFGYLFFPGQLVRLDFKVDLRGANAGAA